MEDFDEFIGRDLALFGVDAEFIEKLKWMDRFVADEVEPLDTLGFSPYDTTHPARDALFRPLQQKVKSRACGRATSARSWAAPDTVNLSSH